MALNDFPDARISYLVLLLAQLCNCLVIPTSPFQSLSPGCFLLPSLKNTYKILTGAARVCLCVIFSHKHARTFAVTCGHTHTHHSALIHTLPDCISIALPHTHTHCLADRCLSNICLSGVFLLMWWLVRKRSSLLATLSVKDFNALKKRLTIK